MTWLWIGLAVVAVGAVALLLVLVLRAVTVTPEEARRRFLQQREHLEADFFLAASRSGKPRGLRWKHCEWEGEVALARERAGGRLFAFAAVTIAFEAIEGSDMEGLAAVDNLRNASAVFFLHGGQWRTGGKAVFNFNPGEAIAHFKKDYEPVGESSA